MGAGGVLRRSRGGGGVPLAGGGAATTLAWGWLTFSESPRAWSAQSDYCKAAEAHNKCHFAGTHVMTNGPLPLGDQFLRLCDRTPPSTARPQAHWPGPQ